ncbi:A24 family peptidase [Alphaproteobacteria bacterium LSUCC0684]
MIFSHHLEFFFIPATIPEFSGTLGAVFFGAVFIAGISLGSFIHTAALRLNRSVDFIFTPSSCQYCNRPLSWRQNLPLIGYLHHYGKCRLCNARISPLYFWTELVMGGFCLMIAFLYPLPVALAWIGGGSLMLLCGLTDLDRMILHLPVMLLLGAAGCVLSLFSFWPVTLIGALLGMILMILGLSAINMLYRFWRGMDGFGEGDIWLLGAVGCWLGPFSAMMVFITASMLGAITGLILIRTGRGNASTALPFASFVSLVFICWPIINLLLIVYV